MVALTPGAESIIKLALIDLYYDGAMGGINSDRSDAEAKIEETKTRIFAAITGAELGYTT